MDDGSFDKKDENLDQASLETPDMEESLETLDTTLETPDTPEVGTTIEAEDIGSTEVTADTITGDIPADDAESAVADSPFVTKNPFLDEESKEDTPEETETPVEEPKEEAPAEDEATADVPVEEEKAPEETAQEDTTVEAEAAAEEVTPVEEETPVEAETPAEEEAPSTDVDPMAAAVATSVATAPVTDSTSTPSSTPATEATPVNEKKKGSKALVIILVIVLLAAAGLCGWYFLSNMNTGDTNNEEPEKVEEEEVSYEIKGNGLNDFDLGFLKLENKGSNKVYSPLSIKIALEMLSEGADGETKNQIDTIIGTYEAKKYINSENLSLANGLFVKNSNKDSIKDSFIKALNDKYNADVVFDSFEKADVLNNWISSKTLKQINKVMEDDEIGDFSFILANALAIDMKWDNRLQCAKDMADCIYYDVNYSHEKYSDYIGLADPGEYEKITFNNQKGVFAAHIGASINNYDIVKKLGEDKIKSTVKKEYEKWLKTDEGHLMTDENGKELSVDEYIDLYMTELKKNYGKENTSTTISILNDDEVKAFSKDLREYSGTQLQYIAIMPKEGDLKDFIKETNAKKISDKISKLKELKKENFKDGVVTKIKGYIPFFKYSDNLELMDDLKSMGIKDVFDSKKADLSKLSSEKNTYIGMMAHNATIDFSNDGIKAAAATIGGGLGDAPYPFDYEWDVPVEEIDMTFDKPFIYLIRDKETGEVWFTGAVYKAGE